MKTSSTNGFTLVELIVVTVIIALFSSLALASINAFTNEKHLSNETKKIMTILELAKSKSNSGDRALCGSGPEITPAVNNFAFQVGSTGQTYKIIPDCLVGVPTPILYSTANGITINPPSQSITFSPLYGKVTCTCLKVQSLYLGKCRYIKISENAVIDEGSCSDCTCTSCTCP